MGPEPVPPRTDSPQWQKAQAALSHKRLSTSVWFMCDRTLGKFSVSSDTVAVRLRTLVVAVVLPQPWFPWFLSRLVLETCTYARVYVYVCVFRVFGLTRPGPAPLGSHWIPRPITGHGSLKRGAHYTESAGHRKPENRICCFTPFAKTPERLPWPHRVTPSSIRSCAAYLSWVSVCFHKPSFRPTRGHIYLFIC